MYRLRLQLTKYVCLAEGLIQIKLLFCRVVFLYLSFALNNILTRATSYAEMYYFFLIFQTQLRQMIWVDIMGGLVSPHFYKPWFQPNHERHFYYHDYRNRFHKPELVYFDEQSPLRGRTFNFLIFTFAKLVPFIQPL